MSRFVAATAAVFLAFTSVLLAGGVAYAATSVTLASGNQNFNTAAFTSIATQTGVTPAVAGYEAAGTIRVTLTVTGSGYILIPSKSGVTFVTGNSSTTTQQTIIITGTQTAVNSAIAEMSYKAVTSGATGVVKVEVSAGSGAVYSTNNHYYEVTTTTTNWTTARSNALAKTVASSTGGTCAGYLATITSAGENQFTLTRATSDSWIGASDDPFYTGDGSNGGEGQWYWIDGPEAGTKFTYANSQTATVSGKYANWASGEPNAWSGSESYAEFYSSNNGLWNDLNNSNYLVSVVEYGTSTCTPAAAAGAA